MEAEEEEEDDDDDEEEEEDDDDVVVVARASLERIAARASLSDCCVTVSRCSSGEGCQ